MYLLNCEVESDWWEVEALFDLCFAPGREALPSYRFRGGVPQISLLSYVARDANGTLAAAVRYWPVIVGDAHSLLLGPIAVHPTRQGEGLGGYLIRETLAVASALGWSRVMLVGDEPYYKRFGFNLLPDVHMPKPINPHRVLGVALEPCAWDGVTGHVRGS